MSGLRKSTPEEITADVRAGLAPHGLDLVQGFDVARYNELIAGRGSLAPLAQFGRPGALAILVGNTKALWPRFIDAFHESDGLRDSSDPLDAWIEGLLRDCTSQIREKCSLRFSHDTGPELVSMLHLAEASGLARTGPAHLAVHPVHGPWFGLRGVIVVDREPPLLPAVSEAAPCDTCHAPCLAALARALAEAPATDIASAWQAWAGIREVCPIGRTSRYDEEQIKYHYTKDRAALYLPGAS